MVDRHVLLDSSVLINVFATNREHEILRIFAAGVGVCAAVEAEALFLRGERSTDPPARILLTPLIDGGWLKRHDLRDDNEKTVYVELAADLDDGEAMTLAIAHQRRLVVATDDRKARRIANQRLGKELVLLRTSEIMHAWVQRARPEETALRGVLKRIEIVARYRPANDDPLREWWTTATT
jgi:predicted nucleic acid-binding protein